ncbi:MAG: COX15/CtaA family protein [Polyangiales bacterium]
MPKDEAPSSRQAQPALVLLASTVVVILWGAVVRATRSGAGCGESWPDCKGQLLPGEAAWTTWIEWSHRASSGLLALGTVAFWVWTRRRFQRGHRVRAAAMAALLFMVLEALIGAAVVRLRLVVDNATLARALWMGAHLINTFLLLAAMTLAWRWSAARPRQASEADGLRPWLWLMLAATVVASASGALTALSDTVFPATSMGAALRAELDPASHWLLRWRSLHPVLALAAAAITLYGAGLFIQAHQNAVLRRLGWLSAGLVLGQCLLGFANVALLTPLPLQLAHLAVAELLWITQVSAWAALRPATVPQSEPTFATLQAQGPA